MLVAEGVVEAVVAVLAVVVVVAVVAVVAVVVVVAALAKRVAELGRLAPACLDTTGNRRHARNVPPPPPSILLAHGTPLLSAQSVLRRTSV